MGTGRRPVRKAVLARDGHKCQICGTKGSRRNKLTMHHIRYKRHKGKFIVSNLITYCELCHRAYHKEYG